MGEEDENGEDKSSTPDLDFEDLYYRYSNEQNDEMRTITAACIHEPFLLAGANEDIKKLQMALLDLMDEDKKEITLALIPNMTTLIKKFINEHSLAQLPDQQCGDLTPPKNSMGLQHSNTMKMHNDFSSMNRKYE